MMMRTSSGLRPEVTLREERQHTCNMHIGQAGCAQLKQVLSSYQSLKYSRDLIFGAIDSETPKVRIRKVDLGPFDRSQLLD